MNPLSGKRILLVEDEFIVAAMAEDMLIELGANVLGTAETLTKAMLLAETEQIDAAVLDVNLRGERVDPVAERLVARRVPIVFTTGYGDGRVNCASNAVIVDKPYTQEILAEALAHALSLD